MDKKRLKDILELEKSKYSSKTYAELSTLSFPITYEMGEGENWCQIEVDLLEKNNDQIHIIVSIDDGKFPRVFFPLSESFIIKV